MTRPMYGVLFLCGVLGLVAAGCGEGEPAAPAKPASVVPSVPKALASVLPADLAGFKAEAEKAKSQADLTMASLDATIAAADKDPRPAFKKFQEDLAGLKTQADAVRARATAMKEKGKGYFQAWETQLAGIATPEIKKAAESRKAEIEKNYDGILAGMASTREGYDKLMTFLGDLTKVLENDLNAAGLKAAAPKVEAAKADLQTVKTSVDGVLAELGKISAIYSPGK